MAQQDQPNLARPCIHGPQLLIQGIGPCFTWNQSHATTIAQQVVDGGNPGLGFPEGSS